MGALHSAAGLLCNFVSVTYTISLQSTSRFEEGRTGSRTGRSQAGQFREPPVTRRATAQENTIKAIVQERYGSPDDVLDPREIDKPVVKDGEVLVRVHAAGVGIGDWLVVRGLPYVARMGYGLL